MLSRVWSRLIGWVGTTRVTHGGDRRPAAGVQNRPKEISQNCSCHACLQEFHNIIDVPGTPQHHVRYLVGPSYMVYECGLDHLVSSKCCDPEI